jgi:hypothetical protein
LQTKEYLARNAKDKADKAGVSLTSHSKVISQLPAPGTKISMQDFTEVKLVVVVTKFHKSSSLFQLVTLKWNLNRFFTSQSQ